MKIVTYSKLSKSYGRLVYNSDQINLNISQQIYNKCLTDPLLNIENQCRIGGIPFDSHLSDVN